MEREAGLARVFVEIAGRQCAVIAAAACGEVQADVHRLRTPRLQHLVCRVDAIQPCLQVHKVAFAFHKLAFYHAGILVRSQARALALDPLWRLPRLPRLVRPKDKVPTVGPARRLPAVGDALQHRLALQPRFEQFLPQLGGVQVSRVSCHVAQRDRAGRVNFVL